MNQQMELLLPVVNEQVATPTADLEKTFLNQVPTTENIPIDIESFKGFFSQFDNLQLDTVEVFIKGVAKTDGILKIIAGLEGEASMKLVLKQKKNE